MKENFFISIETMHAGDRGTQPNVSFLHIKASVDIEVFKRNLRNKNDLNIYDSVNLRMLFSNPAIAGKFLG